MQEWRGPEDVPIEGLATLYSWILEVRWGATRNPYTITLECLAECASVDWVTMVVRESSVSCARIHVNSLQVGCSRRGVCCACNGLSAHQVMLL
jgi:hypothetical protein